MIETLQQGPCVKSNENVFGVCLEFGDDEQPPPSRVHLMLNEVQQKSDLRII